MSTPSEDYVAPYCMDDPCRCGECPDFSEDATDDDAGELDNELFDPKKDLPRLRPPWCPLFLKALTIHGNISRAARDSGRSRKHVYRYKRTWPDFSSDWDNAMQEYKDRIDEELHNIAFIGDDVPVIHQGEITDTYKKRSISTLHKIAEAENPDKYKKRLDVTTDGGPIVTVTLPDNNRGDRDSTGPDSEPESTSHPQDPSLDNA